MDPLPRAVCQRFTNGRHCSILHIVKRLREVVLILLHLE